jgi:hypothetical protein
VNESDIKKVMASTKCSSCAQRYEIENIEVLGHHEDMWFMSVFCVACRAQYLVTAVIDEEGAPETVTDLSAAEVEKFRNAESLKVDEVLDMHRFLKKFDGDFSRLFSEETA